MKHPVLARMLAVILAIVCLIMLLAGVSGREAAENDYEKAAAEHQKLLTRIENYKNLTEKLEGKPPYTEANAAYNKRKAQYERDLSRHRSDVSTHTTTQGGYAMGADMMWEYKAQLVEAQYGLESMAVQLEAQLAAYSESEAIAEQCRAMAELCRGAAGLAGENPTVTEPVPPTPPTMPPQPSFDTPQPQRGDYPEGAEGDAAYLQAAESWLNAYAAYEQALMDYPAQLEAYYAALAEYDTAMALYLEQYAKYQEYQAVASGWKSVRASAEAYLLSIGVTPPAGDDAEALNSLADTFDSLAENSDAAAAAVQATMAALELEMAAANELIGSLNKAIQDSLELTWYEMDGLAEDAEGLSEEKDWLVAEGEALKALRAELDRQRDDENALRSTRLLLMDYEGVGERTEAGEELSSAAGAVAAEMARRAENTHRGQLLRGLLSIAGGAIGLLCVPAGFEKLKSRFFIFAPTFLSMLCAAAAIYINESFSLDTYYAAMPVLIFGLIFLLFSLPRHKVVIRREI